MAEIQMIRNSKDFNKRDLALLKRCYDVLPDSKNLSLLFHLVDRGAAFGYRVLHNTEVVYVAIVLVEQRDGKYRLNAVVGGGVDNAPKHWDEQLKFLKCFNMPIQITGRRGWQRILNKLGFDLDHEFRSLNNKRCAIYVYK